MPAFIHTKADEHKWNAIKHSVAKQRGKSVEDFTDRDWATVNAAWHKSEGNMAKFEEILKSLTSVTKVKVPNAGKMPKPKSMPKPDDKPSLFFKKEDFGDIKHPTIENLRAFLENHRARSQSLK
jgi:hypothetical protein